MPEGTVKTDVDRLVAFVNEKGEMSIQDVAQQLNISSKTVESLADLLEEEGVLQIKYKFTTPYLVPMKKNAAEAAGSKENLVVEKISAIDAAAIKKKPMTAPTPAQITKAAPGKFDTATEQLSAEESGMAAQEFPKSLPESVSGTQAEQTAEKESSGITSSEELAVKTSGGIEEEIDRLIALANAKIAKGDFEGARQAYLQIKKIKNEFPQKMISQERKIEQGVADISESIVVGMDKALSGSLNEKTARINSLMQQASLNILDGKITSLKDLEDVERAYRTVKEIYLTLPEGFLDRKIEVQEKMLGLYKIILTNRRSLLAEEVSGLSKQIIDLMTALAQQISLQKIPEANSTFAQITALYAKIPEGFLHEKTELQTKILDLYQRLILSKEAASSTDFQGKIAGIQAALKEAYSLCQQDRIKHAVSRYKEAADTYASLPEGFFDIRASIEEEMLGLHHLLTLKSSKGLLEVAKAKITEIESLITSANHYLDDKEYDLAKETYMEILEIYNALPSGVIDLNLSVRKKMIELYKRMAMSIQEISLSSPDMAKKYNEMLSLLVQIHECIKNKDFDSIKNKYLMAYQIYHQLPLNLIETKEDVYREIFKVYEELTLMSSISQLSALADSNDFIGLKAELRDAVAELQRLRARYSEDIELFNYAYSRCRFFMDALARQNIGQSQPDNGREIMKKIEEAATAATTIENIAESQNAAASTAIPQNSDIEAKVDIHAGIGEESSKEYLAQVYNQKA